MKILILFLVLVIVLNENVSCYGTESRVSNYPDYQPCRFDYQESRYNGILSPQPQTASLPASLNLFLTIFTCYLEASPISNRQFTPEAMIHFLSEQVRNLIRTGDEANDVPVLDPYEFEWRQVYLAAEEKFNANVNITAGKISGLGNYILKEFNFSNSEISIELNIDIPSLKFYSEYYELDGNIYEALPIKGQGIADIEIQNISLWGKVYLKQSADGKSILLDKIENPEFSIERIVSRTQFDNNIDGVISSMVEDLLADYLNRFNKFIATSYSSHIAPFLNPTFEKYNNWNLIAVLL